MSTIHNPRRARLLGCAAASALLALPLPAAAQQNDGLFTMLGRIILGAGQDKVAIDTPQAVTVLEQEEIDREQAATVSDLLRNVPGVQTVGSDRVQGQAFNIRGIGMTDETPSESRIIVNIDGVQKFYEQYRMGAVFTDPELYKRVEVLRGPASSTLYGSGAIGGTVNFETKEAADLLPEGTRNTLRFKSAYESNGDALLGSVIFASRPTDGFEYLRAINLRDSGEFEDGSGTVIAGSDSQSVAGLLKGTWHLGDGSHRIRASLQRWDSDMADAEVVQTGGGMFSFGTVDRHTIDDTLTLSYENDMPGSAFWNYRVQLSWSDTSVRQENYTPPGPGFACAPSGTFLIFCDSEYAYRTLSLKAENTAEMSGANWENYLTFGLQVSEQERIADVTGPTGVTAPVSFHPEGTDRKLALYVQNEFIWNDRLTLIPGARIEFGEREAGAGVPGGRVTETAFSPKLAAMYEINDNWSVFGSVARTERMPTLDELYAWDAPGGQYPGGREPALDLDKERATTVELGLAWSGYDLMQDGDALQLKATAFHNDIRDMIASNMETGNPAPIARYINVDNAEIWGVELEAGYESDNFFGSLAYANVKSRDEATGLTLASTPAENVALTLGYRLPDQGVEFGWRAAYFDSIATASAATSAPSYHTHDIFASWRPDRGFLEGTEVRFAVENLFDETYRNNLANDNAPGRTFKVSLARPISW